MEIISVVVAIMLLVVACVGFGLQFASYVNTSKNDRPESKKCDR